MSQLATFVPKFVPGTVVETLEGNTGGKVGPDGLGNINVIGDGTTINVAGNALTNTLTISSAGSLATTYTGDSGTATPALGNLNLLGGHNITTSAAGSTVTYNVSGTTNHSLLIGNATNSISNLGVATNGQLPIGSTGADPVLATLTPGTGISITDGAGSITIAASATVATTYTTDSGTATPALNNINFLGGNNISSTGSGSTVHYALTGTTNHDVQIGNAGGSLTSVANGTTGQILTATTGGDPSWQNAASTSITITGDTGGGLTGTSFTFTGGTTGLAFNGAGTTETLGGTLIVANGGTGRATLTNHGLLVGAGTSAITQLADATNGQLPIGSTGADPVLGTLSAGTGIGIVNGAGSITISSTGGGFTWHDVTGGSATLAAQNGYIADSGSLTTFTMPTNNAFGDTINIVGKGSGGWKIVYSAGQNIIFGSSASTATTGNIASTNANDCVVLVCTTASASAPIFTVTSSVGNISIT